MQEIDKFDVKIDVIPNRLKKFMAFTVNINLVFIDSMQFMNSSADPLVKNLSDNDFRYLLQEFIGELSKLVKQTDVYPYEYMNSFKRCFEDRLPNRREFYISLKGECVSDKDYLHTVNFWNIF